MVGRFATSRFRGPGLAWLLPILALFLTAGLVFGGMPDVLGKEQSHRSKRPAASTPVPQADRGAASEDDSSGEEADSDPLDGDPLDGAPAERAKTPNQRERLEITRSGRPSEAPSSVVAYDDDEGTVWSAGEAEDEAWLWLDLEQAHQIDSIRWLARGAGTIQVSVSDDRKRWEPVETAVVRETWQDADVGQEARYVRLDLLTSDDGELPEIAEVQVYGDDEQGDASLAQKAKKDKNTKKGKNKKDRKKDRSNDRKSDRSNRKNRDNDSGSNGNADAGNQTETRDGISIQAGETDCEGDRERCRARAGKAQVTDECGEGSTCTIDVQVDGGSATCDATGGEENRAGNGNGRRSGDGGRCEATANGGTVTMGDINP